MKLSKYVYTTYTSITQVEPQIPCLPGVDLLSLEMPEARSAKAAIVACQEVYRQMKQRVPPLLIHVPRRGLDGWRLVTNLQIFTVRWPQEELMFRLPNEVTNGSFKLVFNMIASDFRIFLYQHGEKKKLGWKEFWKVAWIIERAN